MMPSNGLFPPAKRDRRSRLKRLEYLISNREDGEKASDVVARFIYSEGISTRKAREYIKVLELNKKISKKDVEEIEGNIKIK